MILKFGLSPLTNSMHQPNAVHSRGALMIFVCSLFTHAWVDIKLFTLQELKM